MASLIVLIQTGTLLKVVGAREMLRFVLYNRRPKEIQLLLLLKYDSSSSTTSVMQVVWNGMTSTSTESSNYQNFFLIPVLLVIGMIAVFLLWLVSAVFLFSCGVTTTQT